MATNVSVPLFEAGKRITGKASAAVTGKRFVGISGQGVAPNPSVAHAVAASKPFGVSAYDAAIGDELSILKGGVVPVTAGAALTAGQEVEAGAAGVAVVLAAGKAAGRVLFDTANGAAAYIDLY